MSKITELLCVTEKEICKVKRTYNKTDRDIEEDVNLLLGWLDKQQHLPKPHDKTRLEHFLLRNKFRIERTKIKLDNYYSFKVFYSDFYADLDPKSSALQNARKSFVTALMPKLSPNLDRILYFTFVENQEEHFSLMYCAKFLMLLWEFELSLDYSLAETLVCDFKNMTLKHIMKIDINAFHKMIQLFQQGFSGRYFQIHYVNLSPAVDLLVNMVKRIVNAKLFGKIRLHKNFESLYEFVPKDYLPKEAGGNLESVKDIADKWMEEMILQKEFLKENINRKSIEKLRIGKSAHNELFGVDGTFKKINLD